MQIKNRLQKLAGLFENADYGAMLFTTPSNLYYFSGFRTSIYTRFNALLVLPDGAAVLITSYIDEQLVKQKICDPIEADEVRIHGPIQRSDVFQNHLDTLEPELSKIKTLAVDDLSLSRFNELKHKFKHLKIIEISENLNNLRMIKEIEEIDKIRSANGIAVNCMEKARNLLSTKGMSESELAAELEYHARKQGADGFGYPVLISAGDRIDAPHALPQQRAIPSDTPFVRIAFSPTFKGYCSSIIRTFCRRPFSPKIEELAAAFFKAMSALESILKPGINIQDIISTVRTSYELSKVNNYWSGDMGYSLGLTIHEPPRIGGKISTEIVDGMVLAIMPGLRKQGDAIFHHSDVYRVTKTGCECISIGLQELMLYG